MGHDHSHSHAPQPGHEKALFGALGLTTTFLIAEAIGGLWSGSLALLSDAAHMFTDTAALAIAVAAVRIGRRPADSARTYGYYRFEILAAAFNAVLLFGAALFILYEAWRRLRQPPEIQSTAMLVIACFGLAVNLVGMKLLSSGKEASLNVKGAYLEVWSDMLGSIGVIVGALVIRFTGWAWVDSVVAVAIGLWVLPRTWQLLRESLNVLLEGVPQGIGLDEVEAVIGATPGVDSVHDLHVWSISSGKVSLTVHVVLQPGADGFEVLAAVRRTLAQRFDVHHATVQVEREPCEQEGEAHSFGPAGGSGEHSH